MGWGHVVHAQGPTLEAVHRSGAGALLRLSLQLGVFPQMAAQGPRMATGTTCGGPGRRKTRGCVPRSTCGLRRCGEQRHGPGRGALRTRPLSGRVSLGRGNRSRPQGAQSVPRRPGVSAAPLGAPAEPLPLETQRSPEGQGTCWREPLSPGPVGGVVAQPLVRSPRAPRGALLPCLCRSFSPNTSRSRVCTGAAMRRGAREACATWGSCGEERVVDSEVLSWHVEADGEPVRSLGAQAVEGRGCGQGVPAV